MKAQAALEFSIMVMFAMAVFTVFLIIGVFHSQRVNASRAETAANTLADNIQQELLLAASVPDGYMRNFTIPDKLNSFTFDIDDDNGYLVLELSNNLVVVRRIPEISGNLHVGVNMITKQDGGVSVS